MMRTLFAVVAVFSFLHMNRLQPENVPSVILVERSPDGDAAYAAGVDGSLQLLIPAEAGYVVAGLDDGWLLLDGGTLGLDLRQPNPTPTALNAQDDAELDYKTEIETAIGHAINPLFGPVAVDLPFADYPRIYAMSGEADTSVNFYFVRDGTLIQLTDVQALFSEATAPILSASSDFVAARPAQSPAFLFRARLRDAAGTEFNALYLYEFESDTVLEMPFFGKDPVWSPDGMRLAGSRLETDGSGEPIYSLWVIDLNSGEERFIAHGCNVQWSPDGAWLAYDRHDNARWQGYVDCFANGEVEGFHFESETRVMFSRSLEGAAQLLGWSPAVP